MNGEPRTVAKGDVGKKTFITSDENRLLERGIEYHCHWRRLVAERGGQAVHGQLQPLQGLGV